MRTYKQFDVAEGKIQSREQLEMRLERSFYVDKGRPHCTMLKNLYFVL